MNKAIVAALAVSCVTVSGRASEKVMAGDPATTSRQVAFHDGDIIPLSIERGYVTIVELPETAVAVICGDCQYVDQDGKVAQGSTGKWMVQILHDTNKVSIAAISAGARTNANIMGSSGKLYPFALQEISSVPGAHADLLVRLNQDGATPAISPQRYVSAATADSYKNAATEAQERLKDEQAKSAADLADMKQQIREQAAKDKHEYTWNENSKAAQSFGVKSIYVLDGFTYIEATPQEAPAVYEVRDGKDSLIQASFVKGKYAIPKIVNDGYLRVGKSKLPFHREAKNG